MISAQNRRALGQISSLTIGSAALVFKRVAAYFPKPIEDCGPRQ